MGFLFEKLEVYQRAIGFNQKINSIITKMPKGYFVLIDQLRRAALSIPLNIAEGSGRYHKADKKNFLYIARGSAFECILILELLKRSEFITQTQMEVLRNEIESISQMLSGLIKKFENSDIR